MVTFIEIKELNVAFDDVQVLKNINLNINEGDVIGILGKSGAGKTVLMHVMRGVEEYKNITGNVIYHLARCEKCGYIEPPSKVGQNCPDCKELLKAFDADFVQLSIHDPHRRQITKRISIMLQRTFALYGDEKVITNVINSLTEIGFKDKNITAKAMELLEKVQLSHRMMHIARDLSGGEKQRVVLARQLIRNPMLLLADEPTGTLDPNTAKIVHDVIRNSVKEYNMTMVITSHWPEVIETLANRAIILDDGKIISEGEPKALAQQFSEMVGDNIEKEANVNIGEPVLKVINLKKKYISVSRGVVNAVNDASFEVREGEIFGIAGISGSGKTTTAGVIMGTVQPTSGDVGVRVGDEWIDMRVPGPENRGRALKYMGILHQEYSLYTTSNVIDNLTESIGIDLPYELAVRKAIITLKTTGFTEEKAKAVLSKMPDELSEGERHRVALAQMLMKEPNIIIMDEPTGTMDPITKKDVSKSIIKARAELGNTFIIVSHDMDFLEDVCDRVALMRDGKIIEVGDPQSIIEKLTDVEKIETLDKK